MYFVNNINLEFLNLIINKSVYFWIDGINKYELYFYIYFVYFDIYIVISFVFEGNLLYIVYLKFFFKWEM